MEEEVIKYLYQPNIALEIAILIAMVCSFFKPQYLTALMAALLLLRPNERFNCVVSYPTIIHPVLFLSIFMFSNQLSRSKQFKLDKPLLCFLSYIAVQTVIFRSEDIAQHAFYILTGFLLYYAVVLLSADPNGAMLLGYATVASCFIICGEAIYYHYTAPEESLIWKIFHAGVLDGGRLQAWGNWANANETAFLACIGVANLVFLYMYFRRKYIFLLSAILIPFFTLVIYLTGSRAGLVALVLFPIPIIVFLDHQSVKILLLVLIAIVIVLSSIFTPQRVDKEASSEDRYDLRYGGVQIFKEHPIIGIGFQRARHEFGGKPLHNTYLQALVETGIIGASFLFYHLYRLAARIYQVIQSNRVNKKNNSNAAVVAGFYLSSLFYFLWANQLLSVLFFLIVAQVSIGIKIAENENSSPIPETV